MISVCGLGWMNGEGYGALRKGISVADSSGSGSKGELRRELFQAPFKNFGRLDPVSKMTCYAAALALQDAGIRYPLRNQDDAGIIGTNRTGCLNTDLRYFTDYVESGRTLGRGNLFIYTLPSSPLAEAAIHFGLQGPLVYLGGGESPLTSAVDMAAAMIENGEASMMLAGEAGEEWGFYLVLSEESVATDKNTISLDLARSILRETENVADRVSAFETGTKTDNVGAT